MSEQFSRTALLLGQDAIDQLSHARVAVFGIGGVGGYVCEALVRSGIGAFDLCDDDTVAESNINRQIIATYRSLGRQKTEVMKERMLDINPSVEVRIHNCFFLPENADRFPFEEYDYIVDAVDTVTAKIALIMKAQEYNVPIISCMGAGNKLDPTQFRVTDIYKTQVCPLARVMRRELKKRGIKKCKVVYSQEQALTPKYPSALADSGQKEEEQESSTLSQQIEDQEIGSGEATKHSRRSTPGSVAFVPSVAGLILAGEVIKDLLQR